MDPREHLAEIKAKLVASTAVTSITIVEEYTLLDRGYCRARLELSNDDFLEVAEYFTLEGEGWVTWAKNRKLWQEGR